jgi:hypothetical protein
MPMRGSLGKLVGRRLSTTVCVRFVCMPPPCVCPNPAGIEHDRVRVGWRVCVDACPVAGHHRHLLRVMPPNPELTKEILDMSASIRIDVPDALAASHSKSGGASGRSWITALPGLAANFLDRWALRLDGPAGHAVCLRWRVGCVHRTQYRPGFPTRVMAVPSAEGRAHPAANIE